MAAGLPIVTTSGGSAGEIAGDAGLIVPPADSPALAAALDRLLAEPALARTLARRGRERARSYFDAQRMAAEIEAVYQNYLTAS
jgi:glycosyltransferase involved in cell wall biosynthesis